MSAYCGGTYKGMVDQLDYIKGMGFDAIWISPVVENYENYMTHQYGYHGYWATNWEATNLHFGSEQDLHDLVTAAHNKDIWVMVDVVANHVGPIGTDYSKINPFNKSEHYHDDCQINDWNNQSEVEYCRLADLPDLNQENTYVRDYLKNWIKNLVDTYNFDGIRIDTIPEVPKDFWSEYGESAGVFQMGECFNGDPVYVGGYQGSVTALFNYPMYYTISDVFGNGDHMIKITNRYGAENYTFSDVGALGVFVDNHDNPRFLCNHPGHDIQLKSATVFSLTTLGIPFVYYGTEQYFSGCADPQNRESLWQSMNTNSDLYQIIAKVNQQRKKSQIWTEDWIDRYHSETFYSFSRGRFLVALTNVTDQQHVKVTYQPFNEGEVVCNIFYPTTDCQTVSGGVDIYLVNGESKIYVPQNMLPDSASDISQFVQV